MNHRLQPKPNRLLFGQKLLLIVAALFLFITAQGQNLAFNNASLISGAAGKDGAVYRFSNVTTNVDALVTITGRSSPKVIVTGIDITSSGWDKALQPEVTYSNTTSGQADWWLELLVSFVTHNTTTPVAVTHFDVTALDIDGDGSTIKEYVSLYGLTSYTVESQSQLTVSDITGTVNGVSAITGKQFTAPITNYTGIDTSATRVMATASYDNSTQFRIRTGGIRTSGNASADRMYSFWFKSFIYQIPVQSSLPVVLSAFTAKKLSDKVILNWSTELEESVSHFVVQKSTNGTDFTDAALVFTSGNSTLHKEYSFTDDVKNNMGGLLYYRLKTVDVNGSYEQSAIRVIRLAADQTQPVILVYPNPVTSNVQITVPVAWQDKPVMIQIINLNGQPVKRTAATKTGQTATLYMGDVPAGIYTVQAWCDKETATQKLVKVK